MSTENEVVKTEESKEPQWGKGWLFKKEGLKIALNLKFLMWSMAFLFLLTSLVSILTPAPKVVINMGGMSEPQIIGQDSVVTIKDLGVIGSSNSLYSSSKRKPSNQIGPHVIARPRLGEIPPGVFVSAILVSGASNGPAKAELTEDITLNGETVVSKGAVLVGRGTSTEERLHIKFEKIVYKDGTAEKINATACDIGDKIVGVKGSKISKRALKMGASIGLGFIGGLSDGLQETEVQGGVAVRREADRRPGLATSPR